VSFYITNIDPSLNYGIKSKILMIVRITPALLAGNYVVITDIVSCLPSVDCMRSRYPSLKLKIVVTRVGT
jgi:hypothetical protein